MNRDWYGNICDCDNIGRCNPSDFDLFLPEFALGADSGTDMTGDEIVNADDFNAFLPGFSSGVPGPSGVAPLF